jgi:chromosome segregation ATPase
MSADEGFIDLRLNRQDTQNNESFWPSFTDIMTVIVMIFLIAMVVLLMRNMELVRQLRATMEAERMAAELARTTGEEKESLALRLIATENELSMLRMRLMRNEEERDSLETRSREQQANINRLRNERERLASRVDRLKSESQQLRDQVSSLDSTLATVRQDYSNLESRYQASERQVEQLEQAAADQRQELAEARSIILARDKRLADLQGTYDDLKIQYDKLVKPARTARGKYVVEVRYSKAQGKDVIEYKEPGQAEFKTVSRQALEHRLSALKRRDPDGLYIKVIFPKDSGLSYSEAWSFTSELHKKFDYYFQQAEGKQ